MTGTTTSTRLQEDRVTRPVLTLTSWLHVALCARLAEQDRERGDVPGWVLITLMTAGLVTVLWALAGSALTGMFTEAINGVTGPGAG